MSKGIPQRAIDLYAYMKAREGQWVSAIVLAENFGKLSSRTPISEARLLIAHPNGEDLRYEPRYLPRPGKRALVLSGYRLINLFAPDTPAQSDKYDANAEWQLSAGSEAK